MIVMVYNSSVITYKSIERYCIFPVSRGVKRSWGAAQIRTLYSGDGIYNAIENAKDPYEVQVTHHSLYNETLFNSLHLMSNF